MISFLIIFFFLSVCLTQLLTYNGTHYLLIPGNYNDTWNISSVSYGGYNYHLTKDILVSPGLPTIDSYVNFKFEDPVDDIEESTEKGYFTADDYQTINSNQITRYLSWVFNGSFEYTWSSTAYIHLLKNGTSFRAIPKKYPITTECGCGRVNESAFGNYPDGTCTEECILWKCIAGGKRWGGGECSPLLYDDDVSTIESEYSVWYVTIKPSTSDYNIKIAFGKYSGTSHTLPKAWYQTYLDSSGANQLNTVVCSGGVKPDDTYYWNNKYFNGRTVLSDLTEFRYHSYSLIEIVDTNMEFLLTNGNHELNVTVSSSLFSGELANFLESKRIIMHDIGLHYINYGSMSNKSEWKFVNESYFGYGCNQIMINNYNWYSGACSRPLGGCMNYTLSNWSPQEHGISNVPNYNYLNDSYVTTNISKYSEDNATVLFKFNLGAIKSFTIPSYFISFAQPTVCNFYAIKSVFNNTHMNVSVSFRNCGSNDGNFSMSTYCDSSQTFINTSLVLSISNTNTTISGTVPCTSVTLLSLYLHPQPLWNISSLSWSQEYTRNPTLSPTSSTPTLFTSYPTPFPTLNPTISPTMPCFWNPTVSSSSSNVINHAKFCIRPVVGGFIVDTSEGTSYYVNGASDHGNSTTLYQITIDAADYSYSTNGAADASALDGDGIKYFSSWLEVLLELDYTPTLASSPTVETVSIKFDNISLANDLSTTQLKTDFKTKITAHLISNTILPSSYLTNIILSSGSVIAELTVNSSDSGSDYTASEVIANISNYVASHNTTTTIGNISDPFATINSFYIDGEIDIVFTYCPAYLSFTLTTSSSISWTIPSAIASNGGLVTITQIIGDASGSTFEPGESEYVRYQATSTGLETNYCSFAIIIGGSSTDDVSYISVAWKGIAMVIVGIICIGLFIILMYYGVCRNNQFQNYCCGNREAIRITVSNTREDSVVDGQLEGTGMTSIIPKAKDTEGEISSKNVISSNAPGIDVNIENIASSPSSFNFTLQSPSKVKMSLLN